ncbi:BatA domain-containing protein [Hymenobacter elongatus]|uniref:Aerotolerance regulator N-terminal domain-containing protein n=1 Tax=Hymenobacter elongatus TaxID=877208 RepID=A0A4Z0PSA2_9BACT|nr:BatA domain-containing protein [Hymenobacter elongatus]TGE19733.1 hypothetical protein E5J99_02940 [Hymenobacter elongatus]
MLTFLAPSGLLALLGVAVPIAIHVWNRRPGRTVQVGSIRWLAVAANRRMRNLRLEQLLLLLLRLLLVATLAVAVARPVWQQPPPPRRGQILISPDLLTSASLTAVRPTIDSLRRRGFGLRQLGQGFPLISDTLWQQLRDQPAAAAIVAPQQNFWTRVSQAADSFPGQPVRVFTSAAMRHFRGGRPALPANISWQTVPLPPGTAAWLTGASLITPDSLRLVVQHGNQDGIYTSIHTLAKPWQLPARLPGIAGLPPLRYTLVAGKATIQTLAPDSLRIPVRTQPVRLWVYYDVDHTLDARYLRAALRAAALGLATPLELTVTTTPPPAAQKLDWLCWLANTPVPTLWQQRVAAGLTLWQNGHTPGIAVQTSFAVAPLSQNYPLSRLDTVSVREPNSVLWQATNGRAVLSQRALGRGVFYTFHSRLHPAWSRLGDSPDLPQLWLSLLQPDGAVAPEAQDQRQLDPTQVLRQQRRTTQRPMVPAASTATDLRIWVVLAAALLWGIERLVAGRISSAKAVAL